MNFIKNTAKSYLLFLIIMPIIIIIYTIFMYSSNKIIDESLLNKSSFGVMLLLFFMLGIINGLINKEKGLICGALPTLILFIFIIIIRLFAKNLNYLVIIKTLASTLISAIGGLLGTNLKKKK